VSLPTGVYTLIVSYIGYKTYEETIELDSDLRKNISIGTEGRQLQEVVVDGRSTVTNIRRPEMSVNKLTVAEIKKMPAVLGEVDVLKSILQLPGVTNAGEGSSGFNVRGGSSDQ